MNALKSLKKVAEKVLLITSAVFLGTYLLGNRILDITSPKITSQQQLENLLKKEKQKLNCNKNIEARLVHWDEVSCHKVPFRNKYIIELGGNDITLADLQHELYHIHDGHTDKKLNFFNYVSGEFQAVTYEFFGLEL